MPRKGPATRREIVGDPIYKSVLVTQFVNKILQRGKRSTAERIMYDALALVQEKTGDDPVTVLKRAVDNVRPQLEVRSRRVGGATYQVPVEVRPSRRVALSMRWLVDYARNRGEKSMRQRLAGEIVDAAQGKGNAVKKREDVHRMAEANKAFSHFRF